MQLQQQSLQAKEYQQVKPENFVEEAIAHKNSFPSPGRSWQ
jgi:hypothetical protein